MIYRIWQWLAGIHETEAVRDYPSDETASDQARYAYCMGHLWTWARQIEFVDAS